MRSVRVASSSCDLSSAMSNGTFESSFARRGLAGDKGSPSLSRREDDRLRISASTSRDSAPVVCRDSRRLRESAGSGTHRHGRRRSAWMRIVLSALSFQQCALPVLKMNVLLQSFALETEKANDPVYHQLSLASEKLGIMSSSGLTPQPQGGICFYFSRKCLPH